LFEQFRVNGGFEMTGISIITDIGPQEAGKDVEQKYCGDLPRMSFGSLLLTKNIEVI